MSVIQIPSKNIFSIDNQKVVDNQIDKIEVNGKKATLEITEKTVFNEDIVANGNFLGTASDDAVGLGEVRSNTDYTLVEFQCAYVKVQGTYKTYKIEIPRRNQGNYYIRKIIDGKSDSGNTNINWSLVGKKETGTVLGNITLAIRTNTPNSSVCSIQSWKNALLEQPTISQTDYNITLDYNDDLRSVAESVNLANVVSVAKANVDDLSTAKITATLNKETDCYELEFQILTDLTRITTIGQVPNPSSYYITSDKAIPARLMGTQENYVATRVSLTVNGIVLELNLADKTIEIGDGNNVISFDGNELMQTTNTPSLETQHQAVIDEWKDGKETATVRCSIDDYYDENGEKVIDISEPSKPMMFRVGDIVVPYVYGANGNDKPMSVDVIGTPKEFVVVGKKPLSDGAVWQELTLQEQKITAIKLERMMSGIGNAVIIAYSLVSGSVKGGDKIEYLGEQADVIDKNLVRAKMFGEFYNAIGRTIRITKNK